METEIIKQPEIDQSVIDKKRESWGTMGVTLHKAEFQFQLRAQQSLVNLETLPATIEDIPKAEATLKEVKKDCDLLEADRKKITSKFDPVFERLMAPEKSFVKPISDFTNAIISIKKADEDRKAKERAKQEELAQIRQYIITKANDQDAEFRKLVNEKVNAAYTWALDKNIKPGEECGDYVDRCTFRVKEASFEVPFLDGVQHRLINNDEVYALIDELFVPKIKPASYVELFGEELKKKFSDYESAYNNKEAALKLAAEELQKSNKQIEERQQNSNVSAMLDAVTTDVEVKPSGIKPLKKSYEVDIEAMGETVGTVLKINSAFAANLTQCLTKLKVEKWMSFTPRQAATALSKLKSDDNSFAPQGLIWREVNKL